MTTPGADAEEERELKGVDEGDPESSVATCMSCSSCSESGGGTIALLACLRCCPVLGLLPL
jgi:hypothetical protein